MQWYLDVLKKYAEFGGRARRKEFWMFFLFSMLIMGALSYIERMVRDSAGVISGIYSLAVILPSLSVSVRRLHDTGRSGWWLLIPILPLIGFIVLIVFFCQDSLPGANRYGPNPKEGELDRFGGATL